MIRALAIIAVTGFLLCVLCIGGAAGLVGQSFARGDTHSKWFSGDGLNFNGGSGPVVELDATGAQSSRQIAWNGSDKLTINVPAEVTYTQGQSSGVSITGPSTIVDRIDVEGGEISLRGVRSRNFRGNAKVVIAVTAPAVNQFEFNGAQKVEIRNYDQDRLEIQVNGAGDIKGAGHARSLNLELNGASKVDMTSLALENADIQMNGASDVTAAPTESADVEINGVGQANLLGQPKSLNRSVHGLGSVNVRERSSATPSPSPSPSASPSPPKGDAKAKTT